MSKRQNISVSLDQIVTYWERRQDECSMAVDWSEARERCWRCGYKPRTLERCHIVPDALGGASSPENLVLLCVRCHREAPNVADERFMWLWLRAGCVPFYDTYWTLRGYFEFEQMFGRLPFCEIGLSEDQFNRVDELLKEEDAKATIHFGEGLLNPSTLACIMALIEERITGKLPESPQVEWGQRPFVRMMIRMMGRTDTETSD